MTYNIRKIRSRAKCAHALTLGSTQNAMTRLRAYALTKSLARLLTCTNKRPRIKIMRHGTRTAKIAGETDSENDRILQPRGLRKYKENLEISFLVLPNVGFEVQIHLWKENEDGSRRSARRRGDSDRKLPRSSQPSSHLVVAFFPVEPFFLVGFSASPRPCFVVGVNHLH